MNIYEFIRKQRNDYQTRDITIVDGLQYSQYKTLNTVELYANDTFESGNTDELGFEKPFNNVSTDKVKRETTKTDLDRKDMNVESVDDISIDGQVRSMLLRRKASNWMTGTKFGVLLNKWTRTRSKYGGALLKRIMKNGKVELRVPAWKDMVTDQTDILGGVVIERHFYSPAELKKMDGIWENVDDAIESAKQNKDDNKTIGNDTLSYYVEVWEVHGILPETYLKEDGDPTKFIPQMHVVCGIDSYSENDDGTLTEKGLTLFKGEEDEIPYKYLTRESVPGRGLGKGVVEELFQEQIWTNDAVNEEKRLMHIAGKVFFHKQPGVDGKKLPSNLLKIDNGTLLEAPISMVNSVPGSIPQFGNTMERWQRSADRKTNSQPAITGEGVPANTPYASLQLQNQELNSDFDYRREEAGLFWEEVFMDWLVPQWIKELKRDGALTSEFSREELEWIDAKTLGKYALDMQIESVIAGQPMQAEEATGIVQGAMNERPVTPIRKVTFPKDYFDDWEYKVRFYATNEARNKAVQDISATTILQSIAQDPTLLTDPIKSKIFLPILERNGVSPAVVKDVQAATQAQVPTALNNLQKQAQIEQA
jgi:hypothetical protein